MQCTERAHQRPEEAATRDGEAADPVTLRVLAADLAADIAYYNEIFGELPEGGGGIPAPWDWSRPARRRP